MKSEPVNRVSVTAVLRDRGQLETAIPGPIIDQRNRILRNEAGAIIEIQDYMGRTLWKA